MFPNLYRSDSRPVIFAAAAWLIFATDLLASPPIPNPDSLLIYYGWPSAINGAFSVSRAAMEFGKYDYVVIGDGLENGPGDPNPHPDHFNTLGIIHHPRTTNTHFFGYIDLGVITQNLSFGEIFRRIDDWKEMGVDGILLDDFGYDFGVTRERQNIAVDYAHQQGLSIIANGFRPEDVFSPAVHPNNPSGDSTAINADDFYLYESQQVTLGRFQSQAAWQSKARKIQRFQDDIGFGVFSITTNNPRNAFDEQKFFYSWFSAALYGHQATGWGEYVFSASGPGNAQAPFRDRPDVDLGDTFLTDVLQSGSRFSRKTDRGVIFVDTATHDAGFLPLGDLDGNGTLNALDVDDFETALFNPDAYRATHPQLDPLLLGDFDNNGRLDAFDVETFESYITFGAPIPEPSSAVALLILVGFACRRRPHVTIR